MIERPVWNLWLTCAGPPNTCESSAGCAGAAAVALGLRLGLGAASPVPGPASGSVGAADAPSGATAPVSLSSAAADLCATAGTTAIILRAMKSVGGYLMA